MRLSAFILLLPAIISTFSIPNCPDLDVLEDQSDLTQEQLSNLILCFCKPYEDKKVEISCLYGSNIDHLVKASDAVKNASMTTAKINIQHMDFGDDGLPEIHQLAPQLETLDIRECGGSSSDSPLTVNDTVFNGVEETLRNLTIHSCNLKTVPIAINSLANLETLALTSNKLESLPIDAFANKKQLSYLDVSGNFINDIEASAFEPLTSLETLVIGDHNFINDTVVDEISHLKALKTLDLSRADGIFEPPMKLFDEIPNIESLKLSGCSIPSLEPGQFAALKQLKELDLRVNLIENITAYAFDGLENLKRLSLAGNYISNLEDDIFFGLSSLEELDLGWNEIKNITSTVFKPLIETLKTLNLRHNPLNELQSTGLKNLERLSLAECGLTSINMEQLKDYPSLKEIDLSKCNISMIPADLFDTQKTTLKSIQLQNNRLRSIPPLPSNLPELQSIDISSNPLLCDGEMAHFYFSIEDKINAAKDESATHPFTIHNTNETICDRPYKLRGEQMLALEPEQFQPYDEASDTTTTTTTTTTAATTTDVDESTTTTAFKLPDIFVGSQTNDTLFKEEPRRDIYDLAKANDAKGVYNQKGTYAVAITIGAIALVTIIVVAAVVLFIKKNRKVSTEKNGASPSKGNKEAKIEDGMVEIELNSQPGTQHAPQKR